MRWPWQTRETRAEQPYTDALVELLIRQAGGGDTVITDGGTAVETACRGLWSRAFAVADVKPETAATQALTGAVLSTMVEHLFDRGESLWVIDVEGGRVRLTSAASWTLHSSDFYEVELPEPDQIRTRFLQTDGLVHLRISRPVRRPWEGLGPVGGQSGKSARLLAAVEQRLGQEAAGTIGQVLPMPAVDDSTKGLQDDIPRLGGRTVLVPTTSGNWDQGPTAAAPRSDWMPRRLGADPPAALVQLRRDVCADVAAAAGIDPVLLSDRSDGTSKREAYRHFLHSTVVPTAELILPELRAKLDTPDLALSFDRLFAGDLSGRARSFSQMVSAGMDLAKAAQLSGLMEAE